MTASVAPVYHSRDGNFHYLPTRTSQLRTSMKYEDLVDCREGATIEKRWQGKRSDSIPYQEQISTSLYGRSVEDSLFQPDQKWGYAHSDEPEEFSKRVGRPEWVKEKYPYFLYGPRCPSEIKSARDKENATETMVSDFAAVSPFVEDSLHLSTTSYTEPILRDQHTHKTILPRGHYYDDFESAKDVIMEESSLSSLTSSPGSLPSINSLFGSPLSSPKVFGGLSPASGTHELVKKNPRARQLRNRQTALGLRGLSPSACDDDSITRSLLAASNSPSSTSSGEYGVPIEQFPKSRKKASQAPIHQCKQCNITFTRNFDLQRHNQKHKSDRDTNVDISRRTCNNCGRVLSRVDAARRHVETMPDSCNYIKKKESKPLLPVESPEHYEGLRVHYRKLADETKKPKGRKKAVVVLPPTISV